jgi:hypothetical protein
MSKPRVCERCGPEPYPRDEPVVNGLCGRCRVALQERAVVDHNVQLLEAWVAHEGTRLNVAAALAAEAVAEGLSAGSLRHFRRQCFAWEGSGERRELTKMVTRLTQARAVRGQTFTVLAPPCLEPVGPHQREARP